MPNRNERRAAARLSHCKLAELGILSAQDVSARRQVDPQSDDSIADWALDAICFICATPIVNAPELWLLHGIGGLRVDAICGDCVGGATSGQDIIDRVIAAYRRRSIAIRSIRLEIAGQRLWVGRLRARCGERAAKIGGRPQPNTELRAGAANAVPWYGRLREQAGRGAPDARDIRLADNGQPPSDGSAGVMREGEACRAQLSRIDQLADLNANMRPNEALALRPDLAAPPAEL